MNERIKLSCLKPGEPVPVFSDDDTQGYVTVRDQLDTVLLEVNCEYAKGTVPGNPDEKMVAWFDHILEYKHYTPVRGKFWTSHPGRVYLFQIPADKVELCIGENPSSYAPAAINGLNVRLSCSLSGGSGGVFDILHSRMNVLLRENENGKKPTVTAAMRLLAEIAVPPEEPGSIEERPAGEYYSPDYFQRLVASQLVQKEKRKKWTKLMLDWEHTFPAVPESQEHGPADVIQVLGRKRRVQVQVDRYTHYRVKYSEIDWLKTAEACGISVPSPLMSVSKPARALEKGTEPASVYERLMQVANGDRL